MEVVFIVSPLLESMFTIKYTILYVTFCDTKSTPFKINEHYLHLYLHLPLHGRKSNYISRYVGIIIKIHIYKNFFTDYDMNDKCE